MKQQKYDKIAEAISKDRLSVYASINNEETINNYLKNIEVCRAFYPLLHFFEVCLRNAIDKALTQYLKGKDWFDFLSLDENVINKIDEAKEKIIRRGHPITHGRIVAELSLGFWTSFISKKFSQHQYQGFIFKNAFPNCPKYMRTPKAMQKRFENFRNLRNRISHCERIIHYKNLSNVRSEILESIKWVDLMCMNLL